MVKDILDHVASTNNVKREVVYAIFRSQEKIIARAIRETNFNSFEEMSVILLPSIGKIASSNAKYDTFLNKKLKAKGAREKFERHQNDIKRLQYERKKRGKK